MTRKERERVRDAIQLLHTNDGWDAAMEILYPLAGLQNRVGKVLAASQPVAVTDLPRTEQPFFVKEPGQ